MATFKDISRNAAVRKAFEYWANIVRNYDGWVNEWDFFDLIWRYMRREEVAEMLRIHYTKAELSPLTECGRDPLDLEVDGVNEMLARYGCMDDEYWFNRSEEHTSELQSHA